MRATTSRAFIDCLFLLLLILIFVIGEDKDKTAEDIPPGNLIVTIEWPDDIDADVDLWVKAPGQTPVGYSNKGGLIFDLVRDDLGFHRDVTKRNWEISYTRGLPDGEYVFNLHLYRDRLNSAPFPVEMMVTIRNDKGVTTNIFHQTVTLLRQGQELTVMRLSTKDGRLVSGSINDLPKPLRSP